MKKRLISIACATILFIQNLPQNIIASTIEEKVINKVEKVNDNLNSKIENNDNSKMNEKNSEINFQNNEENLGLDKVKFNAYIDKTKELLFSIGFNTLKGSFIVENQSNKTISEEDPEKIIYKIKVYNKESKIKAEVELKGSDTGNSEKLEVLKNLNYEIGDFIEIIPINKIDILKITGNIQGDITKEKEDYSDGIDNYDYIENVRFKIESDHLNSIYNEAPIINGLVDIIDSDNPNNDIFSGISVNDDHDGIIDNSKIETEINKLEDDILEIRYTVSDSWGRKSTGTRKIFQRKVPQLVDDLPNKEEVIDGGEARTPNNDENVDALALNEIIVEGTPYYDTEVRRLRLRFDTIANQIQIMDEDGRQMSNSVIGDYFKFVLYDKDMNIKTSLTLLGEDKSDTEKLNNIKNYLFEYGDYIGIWHAESESKLKINGDIKVLSKNSDGELVITDEIKHYNEGVPQEDISTRRFRVKKSGLEEIINEAPQIQPLAPVEIIRGKDFDALSYIKNGKITDDFDKFTEDNLDSKVVSISYTTFDTSKVGEQIITYTVTDSWGKSSKVQMSLIVKSTNPLDEKYIEFRNNNESLFKIKFDSVKKQFLVDNLDSVSEEAIDSSISSSLFKLKVYTKNGVLQKTLNIKGNDNLKSVLKRFDGYKYTVGDCIELWSNIPKNIIISGVDMINQEDNDEREDYSDGIDNVDFMKNVRFEIGESTLKYIYNEAPKFIVNPEVELEINRNGELSKSELMEGLTVNDDHDGNSLTQNVVVGDIDTSTIGKKEVEYRVMDSWGRSSITKRSVIVYPYDSLEYNYIVIKNNKTRESILSIRFDDENKVFLVDKIDRSKIPSSLGDNDVVFKLKLIKNKDNNVAIDINEDSEIGKNEEMKVLSLTKADLMSDKKVNQINNLSYTEFSYISIWSYDSKNGIFISGKENALLNGFENDDKMENTRFEIKSSGLKPIYNNAPTITGLNNKLYIYKNQDITQEIATQGLEINDDTGEISLDSIEITDIYGHKLKDQINNSNMSKFKFKLRRSNENNYITTNEVREFILNYKVTDEWGRSATYQRTVSVISKSASNTIEFYENNGNNKLFSIKYNPISSIFEVTSNASNENVDELLFNENNKQTQNSILFKLSVFNENGEAIGEASLGESENTNIESFKENLENITVYDGYYFSLWSNNLSRIRIQGDIIGNDNLGESGDESQNYSESIVNSDYIDNVRFNLTQDGLHAVYNKAPEIRFLNNDLLTVYAGDPINYTKDIQVIDDHDNPENNNIISNDKIKISFINNSNNEDNESNPSDEINEKIKNDEFIEEQRNNLRIGENIVRLTVQDSWGRATTVERRILILNGIDKNRISFKGGDTEVIGIGFNHETRRLNITTYDRAFGTGNNEGYVKIAVYRPNPNGNTPITMVNQINIQVSQIVNNATLQALKNYEFEYGDYFEIYHGHPSRLSITGSIINQREDYSDGVQNPENLLNVKFVITESGLRADYTNPDNNNLTNNKVVFGPVAPEKFPFKVQIDFQQRKFKVIETTYTNILSGHNEVVYKIVLIGKNGRIKRSTEFLGKEDGNIVMSTTKTGSTNNKNWNNQPFEYNDCLYIWHEDSTRSIIKGKIKNQREDYSDGVNNVDNMNNVVFRLTADGLESIYNEAPEIHGVGDKDVYKGEVFSSTEGVSYTDDYDNGHIATSISGDTVNTNELGVYTVTYTATDRWNKSTTVSRRITVRPNLYRNIFKIFPQTNTTLGSNNDLELNASSYFEFNKLKISNAKEGSIDISNSDNISRKPAFEIGFDTIKGTYRVFNQSNDKLSISDLDNIAFTIEIKSEDGNEKANIKLTGNDRGTSPKLLKLNNLNYVEGDIIRVYRSDLSCIEILGNVTGDIPRENDDMNYDNKFDYMKNTGFKVNNEGLIAKYNYAPNIEGVEINRVISKGTIDLLEGINVSDDIDENISKNNIYIYIDDKLVAQPNQYTNIFNYDFNKLRNYKVEYKLYDSWGRATLKESTIKVESKVRENIIQVYSSNGNLSFDINFDANENKFIVRKNDISQNQSEGNYFNLILRDIGGREKLNIELNGNLEHDESELNRLNNLLYSRYDTISLRGATDTTVRITGGVIIEESSGNVIVSNEKYVNGFEEISNYSQVRFKITDDGLKEMKSKNIALTGIGPITIKRGDTLNLLEGVTVNVNDENNEDYAISINEITVEGFSTYNDNEKYNYSIKNGIENKENIVFRKLKEGNYTIRYTITNSWGIEEVFNRIITVMPRNDLEGVNLKVKDNDGNNVLIIGFDSIERKLRVLDFRNNASINFIDNNQVFEINAYDLMGKTLGTIALRGNQIINDSIVSRINNFSYEEGYFLSIWAKQPNRTLDLQGRVINDEGNKIEGLTEKDKMENGRFEVLSNGLRYIYNEAPKIIVGDEVIPYYKGSLLTIPNDMEVLDDHDKINKNEVTINDDEVDYDVLGIQNITYIVEDSWGRSTAKQGRIEIRSAMDSNYINIYSIDKVKNISIGFIRDRVNNQNKIKVDTGDEENIQFDSSILNNTFISVKIYGVNGDILKNVDILGSDTALSAKEKLSDLNTGIQDFVYNNGQYIAIESVTEATKGCIRIQGVVVNSEINYANNIQDIDKIKNVRFKFTDLGLEAVYNKAPVIQIDENVKLDGTILDESTTNKDDIADGIKGDNFNYLRGVKISDDHDTLTKNNLKVIWNPDNSLENQNIKESINNNEKAKDEIVVEGEQLVGRNILRYVVTDSWGRSNIAQRIVNLKNGIFENEIKFGLNDVLNLKFGKVIDDENKVQLNFTINSNIEYFASQGANFKYYGIKVYKPVEGVEDSDLNNYTLASNIELMGNDRPNINLLGNLQNMNIPYGTIIEIYAGHPQRFSINGPVRNAKEDYSDFVQNPENIVNTVFKVTDSGLKAIYIPPETDQLNENENLISLVAPEKIPLKFKITPNRSDGGVITVADSNATRIDNGVSETVFRMQLNGENGAVKRSVECTGNMDGNNPRFSNAFNNFQYEYGDVLIIWHRTPKKILIKGNIDGAREDYSDGIDNSLNLIEAVFKLKPNGLEAVYKSAPRIMGVMDKKVLIGTEINYEELKRSVTADDSIDGPLTNRIDFNYSDVDINRVGLYEAVYSVTNSSNRTARKSSTIVVYDMPEIQSTSNTIIELDSIDNKSEAINEYLKKAVIATDKDDILYDKKTQLSLLSNNVNPSNEGKYKALYKATDLYGNSIEKEVDIQVVRTINVTVPIKLPFQLVTNLMPNEDRNQENDAFVSGVLKIKNNNTSPVKVKVESFSKKINSGELEIVGPNSYDWSNMSTEDSMKKMALGIYVKENSLISSIYGNESNPLWLVKDKKVDINNDIEVEDLEEESEDNIINKELGILPAKDRGSDIPAQGMIGFTSKHGNNFKGGSITGKFELIFKFE